MHILCLNCVFFSLLTNICASSHFPPRVYNEASNSEPFSFDLIGVKSKEGHRQEMAALSDYLLFVKVTLN